MNTKHTPGPWKVSTTYKDAQAGKFSIAPWASQRQSICRLSAREDYPAEYAEANARLIAAAPDLLSVAVDTGRDFDEFAAGCGIEGYDPRSVPDFVATFIERMAANAEGIRAAIAKATAQQ